MKRFAIPLALLALAAPQAPLHAQETVELTPAQMFAFADSARASGDLPTAEAAYRALATNPDIELRTEARFRLALMLDGAGRTRDAAVILREILDEKPDAARVRVELARMQASMGNLREAERELRAAQAAGLPPEVERLVSFYAAALNSRRPFGASFELAFAPDTNVNRATRSDTLGTIIGEFDLSEDAQAKSGIGLATRGQLWTRLPLNPLVDVRGEINVSGDLYRDGQFNDYALGLELGPQVRLGLGRLNLAGIAQWRWYGGTPYTFTYGGQASFQHPLDTRTQARIDATVVRSDDKLNALRDADRLSLTLGLDRAFSARFGGGARLSGQRQLARDPGYSTASGGGSAYLYREMGETTLVASLGYQHLEADERLFLYPRRRVDERIDGSLSATLRSFKVGSFAPVVRLKYERNWSSVEIYDYRRLAAEVGVTAAF